MNFFRSFSLLAATAVTSLAVLLPAQAGEVEIRKNLEDSNPQFLGINEITKTPMPGIYEVRMGGAQIFYTDANGGYLIQGSMLDVKAGKNITQERIDKLTAVDFDKLPLKDAFKIVRGNGKRQLAIFEDPNCGYCKQFEQNMLSVDNVTVYMFLYPILGADSTLKARNIWCASDRVKAWNDWMLNNVQAPVKECDATPLERNRAYGQKYNITGTPTLIFTDGTRAPGAIPAAQVEQRLASIK